MLRRVAELEKLHEAAVVDQPHTIEHDKELSEHIIPRERGNADEEGHHGDEVEDALARLEVVPHVFLGQEPQYVVHQEVGMNDQQ